MEEEIRALLRAAPAVAAHVAGRVNFGAHPQAAPFPALVLNTVGDVEGIDLDGRAGIASARVQVDCYAATYGAAKLLSRAVLATLNGHTGGPAAVVQGIAPAGSRDGRETGANEAAQPFRVSIDFELTFNTED